MPIDYIREHYRSLGKIQKEARAGIGGPRKLAGGTGPTRAPMPKKMKKQFRQIPPRGTVFGEQWR